MRDYSKISPQFWLSEIGRALRKNPEAQLIALYLMTSPHSHMSGIYYLPYILIAHETGLPLEKVTSIMQQLIELKFCSYDETQEYVWIHDMARDQIAPQLKANDNRVKMLNKYVQQLPKLSFIHNFYQCYQEDFHLLVEKSMQKPALQITSKKDSAQNEINFVFEHWKTISKQTSADLTEDLYQAIEKALHSGFSSQQLNEVGNILVKIKPDTNTPYWIKILSQNSLIEQVLNYPHQQIAAVT